MSIYIVAGAPGSGKTTYVRKNKRAGDLIIDVDALYIALSGEDWYDKSSALLPVVLDVRDMIVNNILQYERRKCFYNAWIITSNPTHRHRLANQVGAKSVIVLETSENECMTRIHNDERRRSRAELWRPLVNKFWDNYVPDVSDKVVK